MRFEPILPWPVVALVAAVVVVGVAWRLVRGPVRRRWAVRAVGAAAVVVMLLGPVVPRFTDTTTGTALDVFFVVDRTGSMAAEDWGEDALPRLDGVRHDVMALVEALPGARYGVVSWDSEATRQLPLTTDTRAVRTWTRTVRQEITAHSTGSMTDRPLESLVAALERAAERDPSHVRLVFLLSDGEQTIEGERESFETVAGLVDGGAVLGYGTSEGGPMREYDGSVTPDPEAPYLTEPGTDDVGLSRIDEDELRAIATEMGVDYLHRAGPDDAVVDLVADVDAEELARQGIRERTTWSPLVWPFAAVVAGVLLLEVVVSVADRPRRRSRSTGGAG